MKSFGGAELLIILSVGACGHSSRDFGSDSAGGSGQGGTETAQSGGSVASSAGSGGKASAGAAGEAAAPGGSSNGGAAGQAAAGGDSAGGDSAGGTAGIAGSGSVDGTPPKVLSVSPANGAKGVASDVKIVITFSEAVDRKAAEAALTSSAGVLTYSWNTQSTVLTATPVAALPYATGSIAKSFSIEVSTGLKDLANNHLDAAFASSFSTSRQISLKISRAVTGTYTVSSYPSINASSGDSSPTMGDSFGNDYYRVILDFDIKSLPQTLTSIVSAKLSVPISVKNPVAGETDWGTPLTTLGNLLVDHIYDLPIKQSTLDKVALSSVGTLMTSAVVSSGTKTIDVTAAVADDYANRVARSHHSQYRLQFAKQTDNDASPDLFAVPFSGTMAVDVVYLIP